MDTSFLPPEERPEPPRGIRGYVNSLTKGEFALLAAEVSGISFVGALLTLCILEPSVVTG